MSNIVKPDTSSLKIQEIFDAVYKANKFTPVEKEYKYYAYKNGNVLGMFNTKPEAGKQSKLVERVYINESEYKRSCELEKELRELSYTLLAENVLDEIDLPRTEKNIKSMLNMFYIQNYEVYEIIELAPYFKCLYSE